MYVKAQEKSAACEPPSPRRRFLVHRIHHEFFNEIHSSTSRRLRRQATYLVLLLLLRPEPLRGGGGYVLRGPLPGEQQEGEVTGHCCSCFSDLLRTRLASGGLKTAITVPRDSPSSDSRCSRPLKVHHEKTEIHRTSATSARFGTGVVRTKASTPHPRVQQLLSAVV